MLKDVELLKLELLTQGMKISRYAEEAFTENGKRPATLADYASTSGIPLRLEDDIWVNAPFLEDFCKKSEAVMILNHKKALDHIIKNKKSFGKITIAKIEDIHYLLTKDLGISRGLRKKAVGITGTKYKPLDNEFQIREALEKTCDDVNQEKNPYAKAVMLMILIAYSQPFEDGNKRTSRLVGNAILLAHGICPLSYRSVDEVEYKKAVIIFYEQNNISYFKHLFFEQFEFAVKNYFLAKI